jgi:phosphoribosylaminoimidazolecarboxamide formyltransferase/IMP cyclohydrolase
MDSKKIKSILISVYDKNGLEYLINLIRKYNLIVYSTGGTWDFLKSSGLNPIKVEDLTQFPHMLDGRVKTLHPAVFGGILAKRDDNHLNQLRQFNIPEIDMVVVDLYPFEDTLNTTNVENEIIEKIDIGGISLIRAAAKNFESVLIVPAQEYYKKAIEILEENEMCTTKEQRKNFAKAAFSVSMHYDTIIYKYFSGDEFPVISQNLKNKNVLRYGENAHQKGYFYGNLENHFTKINGKELSYNNLVDIDAAISLIDDLPDNEPCFAILKHTNPCGIASAITIHEAWDRALQCDPQSAFGGIIICNTMINKQTAVKIDEIFYEVLIAPDFDTEAEKILSKKKNRILLKLKESEPKKLKFKSILSGTLVQDSDHVEMQNHDSRHVTKVKPEDDKMADMLFANIAVKHLKSNAIALVKNKQLIGIGCGQTSRIDATIQSIEKAKKNGFDPKGAVLASDAFFPFSDSIEYAFNNEIKTFIQPGGSVNDQSSIDFCDDNGLSMIFTGIRHFLH